MGERPTVLRGRTANGTSGGPLRFGKFELDVAAGELRKNGLKIKLHGQPFEVLIILLQRPGEVVTREELQQSLWSSETIVDFEHGLNKAVNKLREALGDLADTPRYIETLPRRGYRFIAPLTQPSPIQPVVSVAQNRIPAPSKTLDLAPLSEKWHHRWKRAVAISVLALLVIATGAAVYSLLWPLPQPRIVGSHVLTKTGNRKIFGFKPFTDRGSLYFVEQRPSGWVLLAVPASGGEVLAGPTVNGDLTDISRDGSQFLSVMYDPKRKQQDVWIQRVPSGSPRVAVENAIGAFWAADGRIIFVRINNNKFELYRANADGTEIQKLDTVSHIEAPHLSPDGARLRFTSEGPAYTLWELGTDGRKLHALLGGRKEVWGGSWSPDGKHYFFMSWDGDRWSLWTVSEAQHWWRKGSAVPQQLSFGPVSIGAPAISSDGKQLYAVGGEQHGELSVYESKLGKFVPYLGGISVCYVDFSRDGQWIAYVSYPEGTLWRSRMDGSERRQLTVPPLGVVNPRWSPDGKRIAFIDMSNGDRRQMSGGSPKRIYVVSADGGVPELLVENSADPTWSPDGSSIAYAYDPPSLTRTEAEVRILNLQTHKSTTVPGSQGMWSPRWSPDGKNLVAQLMYPSNKLTIFNFARNAWEELVLGEGLGWASWSHDSKFVYAQDGNSLVRIAISDHKKEQLASLQGFRATAYYFDRWNQGWFGLAPDDRPITTRNTGIEEIYAFDLVYK